MKTTISLMGKSPVFKQQALVSVVTVLLYENVTATIHNLLPQILVASVFFFRALLVSTALSYSLILVARYGGSSRYFCLSEA